MGKISIILPVELETEVRECAKRNTRTLTQEVLHRIRNYGLAPEFGERLVGSIMGGSAGVNNYTYGDKIKASYKGLALGEEFTAQQRDDYKVAHPEAKFDFNGKSGLFKLRGK